MTNLEEIKMATMGILFFLGRVIFFITRNINFDKYRCMVVRNFFSGSCCFDLNQCFSV